MKKITVALLLVTAALAGCQRPATKAVPPEEAQRLLLNRNWLDVLPQTDRDRLHVFRFVPSMGGGVYQDRTLYAGSFELFQFERTGEEIRFLLPHKKERATARYRIDALQPGEVENFDLRLQLDRSPRGPATYYGWREDSAADIAAALEAHQQR